MPGTLGSADAGTVAGLVRRAAVATAVMKTTCVQRRSTHPTGPHPFDHVPRPVVARTIPSAPDASVAVVGSLGQRPAAREPKRQESQRIPLMGARENFLEDPWAARG